MSRGRDSSMVGVDGSSMEAMEAMVLDWYPALDWINFHPLHLHNPTAFVNNENVGKVVRVYIFFKETWCV